jgi:HAD superfamily hydrolase (TIGR01509 family)
MMRIRALLVDWRGTLVQIPRLEDLIRQALARIGRSEDPATVRDIARRIERANADAGRAEDARRIDTSADLHRELTLQMFRDASLGEDLAEAVYRVEWAPENRRPYPDAKVVLDAVQRHDVRVAIVSDVHFDIRPDCVAQGIDPFIDAYVLSCEHGMQKPDPRMFQTALDALDASASEALMVGDWAPTDAGALEVGIATLLLPPQPDLADRGLDRVLGLLG